MYDRPLKIIGVECYCKVSWLHKQSACGYGHFSSFFIGRDASDHAQLKIRKVNICKAARSYDRAVFRS
jgi:hypothetical protein